MKRVLISFRQYRERDLLAKGREIQKSMTGNANFPTPTVANATVDATLDDYDAALTDSAIGGKNAIAAKNALKVTVISMLSSNGNYVNSVAEGDVEKLVSSGYTVSKDHQPTKIEVPVILEVRQGKIMGDMIVKAKNQEAAKSKVFEYSKEPLSENTQWISIVSSRSTITIPDLEQGQKYWFRVVFVGSNNQRLYSDPVFEYVKQYGVANAA